MSTSRLLSHNNRSSEDLAPDELPHNEAPPAENIELQIFRRNTLGTEPLDHVLVTDDESDDSDLDETYLLYTTEETNRVIRRFDRYLVPFLALLYMLSFLDRSNIGNARIAGMEADLEMSHGQYEWLLTAFYITYILFEWMALLWKVFPAHAYVAVCVAGWGLVASLQGIVPNYSSLLLARAALGIAEAAFGPGVPFYLSFFYKREELAFRTGLFISAAPLSTAYAGSLAYLLTSLSTGLAPWRALFIIEGWPSLIAAVVAWWYIPDGPGDAWFLKNEEERQIAVIRLQGHSRRQRRMSFFKAVTSKNVNSGRFDWREVMIALGELQNWLTALMFFSCNVAFSSLPVFLPTIINEMGNTALASQALSAPPYVVAFITVILVSYFSDRLHSRSIFVINCALAGAFGYGILAFAPQLGLSDWKWRYAAVYFAASGIFSAIAIIIPWTIGNSESAEGRGTGVAILNLVGQCGPLLGTRLYPARDGPYYTMGMTICGAFMLAVAGLAFWLRVMLAKENRKRDEDYLRRARGQAEAGTYVPGEGKGFRFML
ncbi:hypothetical protein TWF173_010472 [Orbilia oligospora]|uniref:Major facilitator superfamily (MFS) profile domain-containing protein n=1 Tax=Arthrobotrys oligospora (strain ATCC 24927 / CBS 115.81 / DSM 1491) TaxID=756982 RepID=G1X0G5_ARTOA|nr:hypothetical protein AOL_s00006g366 [Orbilia oligospora ATCC 24927]EGX53500.1 hypothetical protein AOL_s00006g366 [Orbilia oligospora ATCC 24927]KAF3317702.1 hypothetical protein TWF173_010472 [Orbilia oligospora]